MATVAAKSVEDTLYTNSYTHILASGLVVPERVKKVRQRREREMVHVHKAACWYVRMCPSTQTDTYNMHEGGEVTNATPKKQARTVQYLITLPKHLPMYANTHT